MAFVVLIGKYSSSGSPNWIKGMGSAVDNENLAGMSVSANGKIIAVTGYTSALKYKNFSGEPVANNISWYFLSRYEE